MMQKKKKKNWSLVYATELQQPERLSKSISFEQMGKQRQEGEGGQKLSQGHIASWWPIGKLSSPRPPDSPCAALCHLQAPRS